MCEVDVYLQQDGETSKILEDVLKVEATTEGVTLYSIREPVRSVRATIREFDSQKHALLLVPLPTCTVLDWIMKRRSIRKYTEAPISDEQVQILLQAAMAAPSGSDIRPWAFIVVRDAIRRQALAELHRWSAMCAEAPLVIAVLGDPTASDHWIEDCSAAVENLLLTVTGLNLGAVWVAVYPRPEREDHVRKVLNIPESLRVLCLIPIGHPAEEKPPRTRYEENKVHYECFGNIRKA